MSGGYYHECDQCHKMVPAVGFHPLYDGRSLPEGWMSIAVYKTAESPALKNYDITDLCSGACLMAYGKSQGWNKSE